MKYPKIKNLFALNKSTFKRDPFFTNPLVAYLRHNLWLVQEKIDGMNIRAIKLPGKDWEVRGRTDAAIISDIVRETVLSGVARFPIMSEATDIITVYGECFGGKIQRGAGYGDGYKFVIFDVAYADAGMMCFMNQWTLREICDEHVLSYVPTLGLMTLEDATARVMGGLHSRLQKASFAEGVVVRPEHSINDRHGVPLRVKIKHRDVFNQDHLLGAFCGGERCIS